MLYMTHQLVKSEPNGGNKKATFRSINWTLHNPSLKQQVAEQLPIKYWDKNFFFHGTPFNNNLVNIQSNSVFCYDT